VFATLVKVWSGVIEVGILVCASTTHDVDPADAEAHSVVAQKHKIASIGGERGWGITLSGYVQQVW
jgi:hypothetical protein